jgi:transcription antitermination factor NusA-like protein
MSEIGEQEKIDIIVWSEDIQEYITNALSPTKVVRVETDTVNQKAKVIVPEDQLSIAIGKGGQNVRLASKLTGYELDIAAEQSAITAPEQPTNDNPEVHVTKPAAVPKLKKKSELESSLLDAIEEHGE